MAKASAGRIAADALMYAAQGGTGKVPDSIAQLPRNEQRRLLRTAGATRASVTATLKRGRS